MSEDEIERKAQKEEQEIRDAKVVMDALGNYVNYRKSPKAFIEAFKREHRTLQQSAFRMLLELVEEMASVSYQTDGRNEDSKKMAQTLLEGFKLAKKQEYLNQGVSEARATEYVGSLSGGKPSQYLPHI